MRKSIMATVAGTMAVGAMLVATPGPALAADDRYCTVTKKTCTAGITPANAQHQVFFSTGNIRTNYRITVRDVNNNKIVYSGDNNVAMWKTLNNVYSRYEAKIICDTGCAGATVHIWN
jgi:hypothetical protein